MGKYVLYGLSRKMTMLNNNFWNFVAFMNKSFQCGMEICEDF